MAEFIDLVFASWDRGQEKMGLNRFIAGEILTAGAMYYGTGAVGAAQGIQGVAAIAGPFIGAVVLPMAVDRASQIYDRLTTGRAVKKFVKTHPDFKGKEKELLELHKESLSRDRLHRGLLTVMEIERENIVHFSGNNLGGLHVCMQQLREDEFSDSIRFNVCSAIKTNNVKVKKNVVNKNKKETAKLTGCEHYEDIPKTQDERKIHEARLEASRKRRKKAKEGRKPNTR